MFVIMCKEQKMISVKEENHVVVMFVNSINGLLNKSVRFMLIVIDVLKNDLSVCVKAHA